VVLELLGDDRDDRSLVPLESNESPVYPHLLLLALHSALVLDEPSEHWQSDGSGIDPGRFSGRERLWIVRIGIKAVVKRDRADDRFDVTRVGQSSAT
jgi:hypothetical protein